MIRNREELVRSAHMKGPLKTRLPTSVRSHTGPASGQNSVTGVPTPLRKLACQIGLSNSLFSNIPHGT